ncbi:MAG TPA: M56 family metallopeptidase [Clostridiales bacterium]|nr:M56 family metallopeptidase [Clostridiales bacterium]
MILLQMNLCATILILLVLIVRYFLLYKLPRRTFLFLWNIVLFHLTIPFPIKLRLNDLKIAKGFAGLIMHTDNVSLTNSEIPIDRMNILRFHGINELVEVDNCLVTFSLKMIWLIGVLFCAAYFLVNHIKRRLEYNQALPHPNGVVDTFQFNLSMKRTIQLKVSDRILSPLTFGIFRPVILIPTVMKIKDECQLKHIIMHELVHIKQFDIAIIWLFTAILCIHWFNPFVWVMCIFIKRDIEVACDEKVLKILGVETKSYYANTLILLEEVRRELISTSINFSINPIEERIVSVMKAKNSHKVIMHVPFIIIFLFIAILMKVNVSAYEGTGDKNNLSNIAVPDLYGKTVDESRSILDIHGLTFIIE